jgi:acyl-CoA thioesterase FadM
MHFMQFMVHDEGNVLAATGEYVAAHVDMRTRRMAPFPESLAQALDQLIGEHGRLEWKAPVCGIMKP